MLLVCMDRCCSIAKIRTAPKSCVIELAAKMKTGPNALHTNPNMSGPVIEPKSSKEPYTPTVAPYILFGATSGTIASNKEVPERPTPTATETKRS
jgi:hypothetical protein